MPITTTFFAEKNPVCSRPNPPAIKHDDDGCGHDDPQPPPALPSSDGQPALADPRIDPAASAPRTAGTTRAGRRGHDEGRSEANPTIRTSVRSSTPVR